MYAIQQMLDKSLGFFTIPVGYKNCKEEGVLQTPETSYLYHAMFILEVLQFVLVVVNKYFCKTIDSNNPRQTLDTNEV